MQEYTAGNFSNDNEILASQLNVYAVDGWEVVSTHYIAHTVPPCVKIIFSRPVSPRASITFLNEHDIQTRIERINGKLGK